MLKGECVDIAVLSQRTPGYPASHQLLGQVRKGRIPRPYPLCTITSKNVRSFPSRRHSTEAGHFYVFATLFRLFVCVSFSCVCLCVLFFLRFSVRSFRLFHLAILTENSLSQALPPQGVSLRYRTVDLCTVCITTVLCYVALYCRVGTTVNQRSVPLGCVAR